MIFFKIFIFSILASSPLLSGENEGWFPVVKEVKIEEESTERDPSIWVLFAKTIDLEKIIVRLPEDPSYKYTESGDFQIRSERAGEVFELTVFQIGSERAAIADKPYLSEGKWIHEHIVHTEHHTYLFRTYANQSGSPHHETFISSFVNFPLSFH